jgi:ribonuclease P protein component
MLARKYRFQGLGSVRPVMRYGTAVRSSHFTLKVMPRRCPAGAACEPRAAVVVSRAVTKKAVVRNRIRRRIYEVLRLNWDRLDRPLDLAFIVHEASVADLPAKELEGRLLDALDRALAAAKPA